MEREGISLALGPTLQGALRALPHCPLLWPAGGGGRTLRGLSIHLSPLRKGCSTVKLSF